MHSWLYRIVRIGRVVQYSLPKTAFDFMHVFMCTVSLCHAHAYRFVVNLIRLIVPTTDMQCLYIVYPINYAVVSSCHSFSSFLSLSSLSPPFLSLSLSHSLSLSVSRSFDDPPSYPAFSGHEKWVTPVVGLTTAVAEMARAITQQMAPSPSTQSGAPSAGVSPGKVTTLRSNYLQQMRDLHSLYASGALKENEFLDQKMPILEQLKKLA